MLGSDAVHGLFVSWPRARARTLGVVLVVLAASAVACRRRAAPAPPPSAGPAANASASASAPTKAGPAVLFIGNSFTFFNDLPGLVRQLAAAKGATVSTDMVAPGGARFEDHAANPATLAKIDERPWDFVVLQEQSQRPSFDDAQVAHDVVPYALALDRRVHAAHATTRTVFYETWGRKNGDADNCKGLPAVCTYAGMQARLSAAYAGLARKTGALLAPVGQAWAAVRAAHPEIDLYASDGVHPGPAGSYLAACVFLNTLLGQPAAGSPPLALPRARAAVLARTADEAVAAWRREHR